MKTRTLSNGSDAGGPMTSARYFSSTDTPTGTTGSATMPDMSLGASIETIEDYPSALYRGFNGCSHTLRKDVVRPLPLTGRYYEASLAYYHIVTSGKYRMWDAYYSGSYPTSLLMGNAGLGISYDQTVEELRSKCMAKFLDNNRVDNLLNLVESGQTLSGLQGVFDFLKRSAKGKAQLLDLSKQFLSYSFGFAPLVSDIKKTYRGMADIRQQLRRLHSRKGSEVTVVEKSIGTPSISGLPKPSDPTWTQGFARDLKVLGVPTRLVGIRGVNRVKYETSLFREIDYILTRYIASGPVTLAWERVPFSFVFDWFVDTSDILNRLDNSLTGGSKVAKQCWTTETYDIMCPVYWKNPLGGNQMPEFQGQQVAIGSEKSYHRKPLELPALSVQASGRFGKKQGLLSLALFHQYVANLRR